MPLKTGSRDADALVVLELGEILNLLTARGPLTVREIVTLLGPQRQRDVLQALKVLDINGVVVFGRQTGRFYLASAIPEKSFATAG